LCYAITSEYFTKVEGNALSTEKRESSLFLAGWRADEWKIVVGILKLGMVGVDFVNEEGNCFVVFVAFD
jgi:hypothetical protein